MGHARTGSAPKATLSPWGCRSYDRPCQVSDTPMPRLRGAGLPERRTYFKRTSRFTLMVSGP